LDGKLLLSKLKGHLKLALPTKFKLKLKGHIKLALPTKFMLEICHGRLMIIACYNYSMNMESFLKQELYVIEKLGLEANLS